MSERMTIGEKMEQMRLQAGAKEYKGHEYMSLNRFADDTRHMIIFDVLVRDGAWGEKGDRMRLYLNDIGFEKANKLQEEGQIKIKSHAKVRAGHLYYDSKEQVR